jgi:hypothetical protein
MYTYRVHYPQTYERSRRRAPLHCFSTLSRSMLICLAPRDLYSPADLIGPQQPCLLRVAVLRRAGWAVARGPPPRLPLQPAAQAPFRSPCA